MRGLSAKSLPQQARGTYRTLRYLGAFSAADPVTHTRINRNPGSSPAWHMHYAAGRWRSQFRLRRFWNWNWRRRWKSSGLRTSRGDARHAPAPAVGVSDLCVHCIGGTDFVSRSGGRRNLFQESHAQVLKARRSVLDQCLTEQPAYMIPSATIEVPPFGQTVAGPVEQVHNIGRAE